MKSESIDRGVVFVIALLVLGLVGAGFALAKAPYVGQTYEKVAAKIISRNGTPVIRTVVGGELPTGQCIVTNAQKSKSKKRTWLLDLNCLNPVAGPGHPGNSVATAEGKVARERQRRAEKWDREVAAYLAGGTKVPWCGRTESHTTTCRNFCARHGVCSEEVLDYLAGL